MVKQTSAPRAAPAAEPAARAPAYTAKLSASADRSYAVTSWPAANTLRTIGPPMRPMPIKPIAAIIHLLFEVETHGAAVVIKPAILHDKPIDAPAALVVVRMHAPGWRHGGEPGRPVLALAIN